MANFFKPTTGRPLADANAYSISKLNVMQGGTANFGLWGGDEGGKRLTVKLVRAGEEIELKSGWSGKISGQITIQQSKESAVVTIFTMSGLRAGDRLQSYALDGRPFCALAIDVIPESQGLMAEWNALLSDSIKLQSFLVKNDSLYPAAKPYLKWTSGKTLTSKGALLSQVNGLAVHTTGNGKDKGGKGIGATTEGNLVAWRCLSTWNTNGASAHFAIAGSGTVVQFVPCNRVANAQGSGNVSWLSVEIDNDGTSPMLAPQLEALKALYGWVKTRYHAPPKIATGWLPPGAAFFDASTKEICKDTTTDVNVAIASQGLSCHWWLDKDKGPKAHGCPGKGILAQLPSVVA